MVSWLRLRHRQHVDYEDTLTGGVADQTRPQKAGQNLTPNLRALRLAMTVSDTLLSMNVSASSVVSRALDVTETYCENPVHIDINANLIMLSQLRNLESEPLTLIRPVSLRETNNMTIQSIQNLVYKIRHGDLDLDQAETELDQILKHPIVYPKWLIPIAGAALAAAVDLMFTTNWRVILVTFVIVWLVDKLALYLSRKAITPFFRQAAAGMFVTLLAAVINFLAVKGVVFFDGMNPTLIVVGGIIMLLSGLAIVAGVQDAIDEYYVTANARILRVFMLTAAIVMGVLIGLYLAKKASIGIALSPNPLGLTALHFQIIGGALAAGAFAVSTQTRIRAVLWAGLVGGVALAVAYSMRHAGFALVPASGIAAVVVGALAKFLSRAWRTPASGITAAGIVPLVPGLSLYTGLMQLVNYPPGNVLFSRGIGTLFTAIAIALAIAAGASFGNIIARPFNQRRSHMRNYRQFSSFMRRQLRLSRRNKLASIALLRQTDYSKQSDKPYEHKM